MEEKEKGEIVEAEIETAVEETPKEETKEEAKEESKKPEKTESVSEYCCRKPSKVPLIISIVAILFGATGFCFGFLAFQKNSNPIAFVGKVMSLLLEGLQPLINKLLAYGLLVPTNLLCNTLILPVKKQDRTW